MTKPLLNTAALEDLDPSVQKPTDAVLKAGVGIVHLGIGAFHRAHQAVYTEDAINSSGGDWRICGVSLRSASVRDQMKAQDCLYSVTARSEAGDSARVMGAVADVLFAPEDPMAVIDMMAAPSVHVISLTVTEKGYCHDPATGKLQTDLPEIQNDLDMENPPQTALGYLVRGLLAREEKGSGPVNIISCDNLPDNGRILEGLVREFCQISSPGLLSWLDENAAFPCTMIDRIVPASTDEARALIARTVGVSDAAGLLTEPFKQWVIEDKFKAPRPAWDVAGAEIVPDVAAFEAMKLRLLNGSHSTIAYLGYLSGHKTVSDAVAKPPLAAFVRQLMDEEATPTLDIPKGFHVSAYKDDLMARFANPTLAHKTWQIAMDGSQKLPQRLLDTLYHNMRSGGPTGAAALAVAGWMQYVGGVDEAGEAIDVSDPLADELAAVHKQAGGDVEAIVMGLLAIDKIFGPMEDQPVGLDYILMDALGQLRDHGALYCVENYC